MAKEDRKELLRFLTPYPDHVKETALWLREFVWDMYPQCNELIYDNYNALAFGWSLTYKLADTFCGIAAYRQHVNFGFNRGTEISDPEKKLKGSGSLYRSITIKNKTDFPKAYIKKLLKEAYVNALSKLKENKQSIKGLTITKSISAKKRRRFEIILAVE